MSQLSPNTSISFCTKLLCYLGPPLIILLTYSASPQAALLTPLAFVPSTLFHPYLKRINKVGSSCRGEPEPLIWTYTSAGTVGPAGVAITQLIIYSFFYLLKTLADSSPSSSRNSIFNIVTSFIATALVEEVARVLPLIYARRRCSAESRKPGNRAYIYYILAGLLGLDLAQSITWLTRIYADGQETFPEILLLLSTRIAIGASGSRLRGTSTALRAIRKYHLGERLSW
ncbi:hypothetical protein EG328_000347 [Venturia inaequalis]|uniref:Uncharacterized protein n=1 Tax=Venturia inaequalis TaxID=5025 RepID=A0A8H3U3N9_VENIN|nr:hypothetical protein EG328_000347 [Venturia inaequalis]